MAVLLWQYERTIHGDHLSTDPYQRRCWFAGISDPCDSDRRAAAANRPECGDDFLPAPAPSAFGRVVRGGAGGGGVGCALRLGPPLHAGVRLDAARHPALARVVWAELRRVGVELRAVRSRL